MKLPLFPASSLVNSADLPEKIRAFLAIFPTETIIAELTTLQKRLENVLSAKAVRWTKPEQIHLSLQFLGNVECNRLTEFEAAIQLAVEGYNVFELRAEKLGCFPNNRRPRILWVGLTGKLNDLQHLKEELDSAFSNVGYVPEKRDFHPHFTIGRVAELTSTDVKHLVHEISRCDSKSFGELNVAEIHLMQSVLSPKGAEYRVLKSFPLGNF